MPLDTTAAQPKLKLYRYVSPSLSRSLFLPLSLQCSISLSLSSSPSQPVVSSFSPASSRSFSLFLSLYLPSFLSLSLCIFTFPFLFLFPSTSLVFLPVSLSLHSLAFPRTYTRRYSKRPTAFARYLPPKSTLRFLRPLPRAHSSHPLESLEGIYRLRSLNNETPFPRLRLNSRPEEA